MSAVRERRSTVVSCIFDEGFGVYGVVFIHKLTD